MEEKIDVCSEKEFTASHEIHYVIEDTTVEDGNEEEELEEGVTEEMDAGQDEIETHAEYKARKEVLEEQKPNTSCTSAKVWK